MQNNSTLTITEYIINHPPQGALIHPQCLGYPSQSVNFKKRFNCEKMVLFDAMIYVMGRS